jgi:hypothetical protein
MHYPGLADACIPGRMLFFNRACGKALSQSQYEKSGLIHGLLCAANCVIG